MKRKFISFVVCAIDLAILILLLFLYMRNYSIIISTIIFIYLIANALILAVCYQDHLMREVDYCYKHLSDTKLTEVIPLNVKRNAYVESLKETATFKALLIPNEGVNIFVRKNSEFTDILHSSVNFEDFRKNYKIK